MTLKNLEKQLAEAPPKAFFILGPEAFLIKKSLRMIKNHFLSKEQADFNFEVFRAGEMKLEKLYEMTSTLPVFSEKRLVVCQNSENFKESDEKALHQILKESEHHCILIFISSSADKRKKIIKYLSQNTYLMPADKVKEKEILPWILHLSKAEGLKLSTGSANLLKEYAGLDLLHLEQEIKKIKNFSKGKSVISEEDILKIVPRVQPENIFALSQAIGKRNLPKALTSLARLMEDQQNTIGALALIIRHIRILARVKEGLALGLSPQTIALKTGVPGFFIKNYSQTAKLWTPAKIHSTLEVLKATDKALKSSPLSSHIWLENFIVKTCSI